MVESKAKAADRNTKQRVKLFHLNGAEIVAFGMEKRKNREEKKMGEGKRPSQILGIKGREKREIYGHL